MPAELTLLIPCYNSGLFIQESFTKIDACLGTTAYLHVLFIEDCGKDETFQILNASIKKSAHKEKYTLLKNEQNLGKGGTIKKGIALCSTELIVFTDPDLAYDLSNIFVLYKAVKSGEMLIANRVHPDSRYLIPPSFFRYIFTRHLSSRIYNRLSQLLLIPGIEDNQAGLKMFFISDLKPLLAKSRQNDFSFDLELLVIAHVNDIKIKGMPVYFKYEYEASTVVFMKDSMRLFLGLLKIFFLRIGNYYTTVK